jgi:hypothetical protein
MNAETIALLRHRGDLRERVAIGPETPLPRKGELVTHGGEKFRVVEVTHEYPELSDDDVSAASPTVHVELTRTQDRY